MFLPCHVCYWVNAIVCDVNIIWEVKSYQRESCKRKIINAIAVPFQYSVSNQGESCKIPNAWQDCFNWENFVSFRATEHFLLDKLIFSLENLTTKVSGSTNKANVRLTNKSTK